ncbi:MAG: tyrosine-type recombinase/integrase, partial [Phycisphaeraceae bacterium]|nr:tyrosine-type recombinase/integrase [Phycisphaeraceae bacterium]
MNKKAEGLRHRGTGSLVKRPGRSVWLARFTDHRGQRREVSMRTTDRAKAEHLLRERLEAERLRKLGAPVAIPGESSRSEPARKALADHVADYLTECSSTQSAGTIALKRGHLCRVIAALTDPRRRSPKLVDLTAEAVASAMRSMQSGALPANGRAHLEALDLVKTLVRARGVRDVETPAPRRRRSPRAEAVGDSRLSARTCNAMRQTVRAFASWCRRRGRAASDWRPGDVQAFKESMDRRRERRALSDDELARLLAVARSRGRLAWYLAALHAGLRRGDLLRLKWRDIDFDEATLMIRGGKSGRDDQLPLHPELADELRSMRPLLAPAALATARVFPRAVSDRERRDDFEAARIPPRDAEGRVADLHALRTTLGTRLARAGVAPQVARVLMRHTDYRTTLAHYTALGLHDAAGALASLPSVAVVSRAATGTTDGSGSTTVKGRSGRAPHEAPHQLGEQWRIPATLGDGAAPAMNRTEPANHLGKHAVFCGAGEKRAKGLEP